MKLGSVSSHDTRDLDNTRGFDDTHDFDDRRGFDDRRDDSNDCPAFRVFDLRSN